MKCYVYGKYNHIAKDCNNRQSQTSKALGPQESFKPQANVVSLVASSCFPTHMYFISSPELNMIFNSNDWWLDSPTNVHECANKRLFSFYYLVSSTRIVGTGNEIVA